MYSFREALEFMQANNNGVLLQNECAIVGVMCDEFARLRRDTEFLYTDYDILETCHDCGIFDMAVLENAIADACGGQCLQGEVETQLRQVADTLRANGDNSQVNLIERTCGKIYCYIGSLLITLNQLHPNGVTDISVRRLVRFVLGHERQHALQTVDFIMQGRTAESAQLILANAEDIDATAISTYLAIPSEIEADAAGHRFMLELEQ